MRFGFRIEAVWGLAIYMACMELGIIRLGALVGVQLERRDRITLRLDLREK